MTDNNRSRGVLTDSDRDILQDDWEGKPRQEKQPLYNLRSHVRSRIDELVGDLRLLQHRQPDLFDDIAPQLDGVEWADPDTTYRGETRENGDVVLADGEPISVRRDVAEHAQTDDLAFGYRGAGPRQCATALLAHATDPDIAVRWLMEFAAACTYTLPDEWELTADEIQQWVRMVENEDQDEYMKLYPLDSSDFSDEMEKSGLIDFY